MKKSLFILCVVFTFSATGAFANGMVFDPTAYPAIEEIPVTNTASTASPANVETNKSIEDDIIHSSTLSQDAISGQNDNFNDALFKLDNAQVNMRNELLEYQAKYQEVDKQFQLIKEQRKVLSKQVKNIQNKINAIEKSKQNIRKTMI